MTKALGGKITLEGLSLHWRCDVCKLDRAHGSHKRCSRVRQEHYRNLRKTESIQQKDKADE